MGTSGGNCTFFLFRAGRASQFMLVGCKNRRRFAGAERHLISNGESTRDKGCRTQQEWMLKLRCLFLLAKRNCS
jgi:hypothetical protein